MDVEPCYPLCSAELESAEALTSSQQKFQTLNLADCSVRQFIANDACLLPHEPVVYEFESRPEVR